MGGELFPRFAVLSVLSASSALKDKAGRRAGMTLLEVLLTMAIFLAGSVGIIGLFVAASVLHVDASNRRTASFIAQELLAQVSARPFRDVYAQTRIFPVPGGDAGGTISVFSVNAQPQYQAAAFDRYPLPLGGARTAGFVLLEGGGGVPDELAYYTALLNSGVPPDALQNVVRPIVPGVGGVHPDDSRVLSPRTWDFCLQDGDLAAPGNQPLGDGQNPLLNTFTVYGTPPPGGIPLEGYLVIDREWMPYTYAAAVFTVPDVKDRGWGNSTATPHSIGAPVTIAREHPRYAGFWYTVQYYPVNARGAESKFVVSIGFGNKTRFSAQTFEGIYTPTTY